MIDRIKMMTMLLIIISCLSGCIGTKLYQEFSADNKIVAVSILPQVDFVKAVGGDKINILTMIPPGSSPATYMPKPKQMTKLSEADVYFSIGVPAEKIYITPKLKDINKNMLIINLPTKVKDVYEITREGDPHIWMSPKRVIVMIEQIRDTLCEVDDENSEYYKKNASEYIDKLRKLDDNLKDKFKSVDKKKFMIYHPSLGYFADDYGLEMIPIEKDGKKVSTKTLKNIIDNTKNNIKTIFYQKEFDSKQAKIIAQEINATVKEIDILSENYIDNLSHIGEEIFLSLNNK